MNEEIITKVLVGIMLISFAIGLALMPLTTKSKKSKKDK